MYFSTCNTLRPHPTVTLPQDPEASAVIHAAPNWSAAYSTTSARGLVCNQCLTTSRSHPHLPQHPDLVLIYFPHAVELRDPFRERSRVSNLRDGKFKAGSVRNESISGVRPSLFGAEYIQIVLYAVRLIWNLLGMLFDNLSSSPTAGIRPAPQDQ